MTYKRTTKQRPLGDRFWEKVEILPNCWEWRGAGNLRYGQINRGDGTRKLGLAHRVAWELCFGPIPQGMSICHRCDNTKCVRPSHLFLGTQRDNIRDAIRKGRIILQRPNAALIARTHCSKGHLFTPENTFWRSNGSKTCRECANAPRRRGLRGTYRRKNCG